MTWMISGICLLLAIGIGIAIYEWRSREVLLKHDFAEEPHSHIGSPVAQVKLNTTPINKTNTRI